MPVGGVHFICLLHNRLAIISHVILIYDQYHYNLIFSSDRMIYLCIFKICHNKFQIISNIEVSQQIQISCTYKTHSALYELVFAQWSDQPLFNVREALGAAISYKDYHYRSMHSYT